MYYTMSQHGAAGWLEPLTTWHFPLIQNIKRDPFEQFVEPNDTKSLMGFGGSLAAPSTAFMYDGLGIMPLGQLWLKELLSYQTYPPCRPLKPITSLRSFRRSKKCTTITRATNGRTRSRSAALF